MSGIVGHVSAGGGSIGLVLGYAEGSRRVRRECISRILTCSRFAGFLQRRGTLRG